jgi:hypothetical protein
MHVLATVARRRVDGADIKERRGFRRFFAGDHLEFEYRGEESNGL